MKALRRKEAREKGGRGGSLHSGQLAGGLSWCRLPEESAEMLPLGIGLLMRKTRKVCDLNSQWREGLDHG